MCNKMPKSRSFANRSLFTVAHVLTLITSRALHHGPFGSPSTEDTWSQFEKSLDHISAFYLYRTPIPTLAEIYSHQETHADELLVSANDFQSFREHAKRILLL